MGCSDSKLNLPNDVNRQTINKQMQPPESETSKKCKNNSPGGNSNELSRELIKSDDQLSFAGKKKLSVAKLIKSPRKSLLVEPKTLDDIPILQANLVEERVLNPFENDYDIIGDIGSGSFGSVYKIMQKNTELIRALKVVKKEVVTYQDDDRVFLKEIEILAELDHPNILKIYEFFFDGQNYYIVTEFLDGGELLEQIYTIPDYCENSAAIIMKQILSAVSYLHSKNIVHRDLKPENIILKISNNELFVKIIDFGTANFHNNSNFTLQYGTCYYLAPEILQNNYSSKCDIWSCGVILYTILSGTPPFRGKNDEETLSLVEKGKYSFDRPEFKLISAEAKDLISQLLTYEPEKRPTVEVCLSHSWIVENNKQKVKVDYDKILVNLNKFNSAQKLQQSCLAYIIHQVSSTEIASKLRIIFNSLDKKGDGRLRVTDLKESIEKHYTQEVAKKMDCGSMLSKFDTKSKEVIEYEEFLRMSLDMNVVLTDKNLKMAFNHFDEDKTGRISFSNIKKALGIYFNDDSKEKEIVQKILQEANLDSRGNITYKEFKNFMSKLLV